MGEDRRIQGIGGKLERKSPIGRPRRRWEYNSKTDLQEVGCVDMDWLDVAQDREV